MGGQKPLLPAQEYFNIGEACRILQVPAYTLRYWESQFKHLRPTRRHSGHRRYSRRDMETAFQIKDLLHIKKMTAAGARKTLASRQRGGRLPGAPDAAPPPGLVKLLRHVRDELARMSSDLNT